MPVSIRSRMRERAHIVRPAPRYRVRHPEVGARLLLGRMAEPGVFRQFFGSAPSSPTQELTSAPIQENSMYEVEDRRVSYGNHGPAHHHHAEMQDGHVEELEAHLGDFGYLTPFWSAEFRLSVPVTNDTLFDCTVPAPPWRQ